jgi:hypothetical protein
MITNVIKERCGVSVSIINKSFSKFGHYYVGDKIFSNKIQALEYASSHDLQPHWYFNDAEFSQYNWFTEPCESLDEIYKKRAQQIRDRYDNVILFYSGGVDSHNILMTFIRNDIKLDAVIIYGTFDFDRGKNHRFNLELYNQAIPAAQKYQHLYDLHLLDISDLYRTCYHTDWIYQGGVQLAPFEYVLGHIYDQPYINQWFERGSTAIVRGIDKPRVFFHNNRFYFSFLDCSLMQTPSLISEQGRWLVDSTEFFYWSPDAPWLVAKQSHVIKNYFTNIKPELRNLLTHTNQYHHDTVERYINPLIYDLGTAPGHCPGYYTLGKGPVQGPVFHHKDDWFHSGQIELSSQQIWKNGIAEIDRIIDVRFKNQGNLKRGLVGFWSKWYEIGC